MKIYLYICKQLIKIRLTIKNVAKYETYGSPT